MTTPQATPRQRACPTCSTEMAVPQVVEHEVRDKSSHKASWTFLQWRCKNCQTRVEVPVQFAAAEWPNSRPTVAPTLVPRMTPVQKDDLEKLLKKQTTWEDAEDQGTALSEQAYDNLNAASVETITIRDLPPVITSEAVVTGNVPAEELDVPSL